MTIPTVGRVRWGVCGRRERPRCLPFDDSCTKGRIRGSCTRTRPSAPRRTCHTGRGRSRGTRGHRRGTSRTRARRIADSQSRAPNDRARCREAPRHDPARRHRARCLQAGGGHSHASRSEWHGHGGRQACSAGGAGAMPRACVNDLGGLEARSDWRCPPAGHSSIRMSGSRTRNKRPSSVDRIAAVRRIQPDRPPSIQARRAT